MSLSFTERLQRHVEALRARIAAMGEGEATERLKQRLAVAERLLEDYREGGKLPEA